MRSSRAGQQFERGRIPADVTHDCVIDISNTTASPPLIITASFSWSVTSRPRAKTQISDFGGG
jgi:hypothetical protein